MATEQTCEKPVETAPGPADALNSYYDACLAASATVVANGAAFQADLNTAAGAATTNGVTQLYALASATTARAVALMAASVRS